VSAERPATFETRGDLAREQLRRRGALYDGDVEDEVRARLERLTEDARRAFALVCAERAMAWHEGLPPEEQRPFTLGWGPTLKAIRAGLTGETADARARVQEALDAFRASPYDHSDGQDGPDDADEDAAAASIYAAECSLDGSVDPAVWAASRMVEIGYGIAQDELGLDSNEFEWDAAADPPSPLAQENMHAAVSDELKRQLADLQELEAGDIAGFLGRRRA
jgi:hypothetical protein